MNNYDNFFNEIISQDKLNFKVDSGIQTRLQNRLILKSQTKNISENTIAAFLSSLFSLQHVAIKAGVFGIMIFCFLWFGNLNQNSAQYLKNDSLSSYNAHSLFDTVTARVDTSLQ